MSAENQKKRSKSSSEKKSKKKVKIETAADAVRALDDIVLDPFPLQIQLEEIPVTEKSKIHSSFFDNHVKMNYTAVGQVYMTSTSDQDIRVPLVGDMKDGNLFLGNLRKSASNLRDRTMF